VGRAWVHDSCCLQEYVCEFVVHRVFEWQLSVGLITALLQG